MELNSPDRNPLTEANSNINNRAARLHTNSNTLRQPSMLQVHSLKLHPLMHNEYGKAYHQNQKDNAGCYASFIKCVGKVPQNTCCILAAFEKGPMKRISTGHIGLLTEFGRLIGKLEPGLHTYNPCSQKILVVDLRTRVLKIPPQMLLTKDNVTLTVDGYVLYKIVIPELAIYKVDNYERLVNYMTQGVLKSIVSERTLGELLVCRDEIEEAMTKDIDRKTDRFGIKVVAIEMQSMDLPNDMERAMATVAESKKESEAKVIDAQGNLESAKIFRMAADEMRGNPISLQLQYFEMIKAVAVENDSTIVVTDNVIRDL